MSDNRAVEWSCGFPALGERQGPQEVDEEDWSPVQSDGTGEEISGLAAPACIRGVEE